MSEKINYTLENLKIKVQNITRYSNHTKTRACYIDYTLT